jgi:hypothetical protein
MTKTIRVKMKKGAIYDEVVWPTDYVLEMDEVHATYLCGTGFAEPSTEQLYTYLLKIKQQLLVKLSQMLLKM